MGVCPCSENWPEICGNKDHFDLSNSRKGKKGHENRKQLEPKKAPLGPKSPFFWAIVEARQLHPLPARKLARPGPPSVIQVWAIATIWRASSGVSLFAPRARHANPNWPDCGGAPVLSGQKPQPGHRHWMDWLAQAAAGADPRGWRLWVSLVVGCKMLPAKKKLGSGRWMIFRKSSPHRGRCALAGGTTGGAGDPRPLWDRRPTAAIWVSGPPGKKHASDSSHAPALAGSVLKAGGRWPPPDHPPGADARLEFSPQPPHAITFKAWS